MSAEFGLHRGELRTDRVRWDCARARRDSLRSCRVDFVGGFSGLEGALLDAGEGRVLLFSKVGAFHHSRRRMDTGIEATLEVRIRTDTEGVFLCLEGL